ncbi:hypothetical protein NSK_005673, partial [Nannochloropsis salina CCMP1776]
GRVVVLGETGRNFAAGMSGGIAYILDPERAFPDRCNKGLVALETVETEEEAALLKSYIQEHVAMTGSEVGKKVLAEWPALIHQFVKVMPIDYKRVLRQLAEEGEEENSGDEAQVAISY